MSAKTSVAGERQRTDAESNACRPAMAIDEYIEELSFAVRARPNR